MTRTEALYQLGKFRSRWQDEHWNMPWNLEPRITVGEAHDKVLAEVEDQKDGTLPYSLGKRVERMTVQGSAGGMPPSARILRIYLDDEQIEELEEGETVDEYPSRGLVVRVAKR